MKKLTLAVISMLLIFVSCKKDADDSPGASSRVLRYELSGNYTGTLFASYTTAPGGTANDQVTLPWNKEVTYASSVTAAAIVISGNAGVAGQKVTLVVKRGGNQVGSPKVFTAPASGSFSEAGPVIVF